VLKLPDQGKGEKEKKKSEWGYQIFRPILDQVGHAGKATEADSARETAGKREKNRVICRSIRPGKEKNIFKWEFLYLLWPMRLGGGCEGARGNMSTVEDSINSSILRSAR